MPESSRWQRVRVYLSEGDRWQGKPLADAIVRRAQELGLAGATVLRGVEGYGAHHAVHTSHLVEVADHLPLVVEIVDAAEAVARLLPELDRMIAEGLVTVEDVTVTLYRRRTPG